MIRRFASSLLRASGPRASGADRETGWTARVQPRQSHPDVDSSGTPTATRLPPGASRGFTLVEVMISMVVLGGLAASAFYILNSQSGMGMRTNDVLKGVNFGKLAMDSLKVADYSVLEAGSDTVSDRYIRSWRITLGTDGHGVPNGRKRIDLTVHWPKTAEHVLTFASVKSDGRFKEGR